MRTGLARVLLGLLVACGLASGCAAHAPRNQASTTSGAASSATPAPSGSPTVSSTPAASSATPLSTSGAPSVAAAVANVPGGPGSGPVTITYDGLGQAVSTFVGQCSHDGPATTLSGTAGTATVDLVFDPASVTLTVTDVGLGTSKAALARVDLTVAGGRVKLSAPLVSGTETIGSVSMDVTCSG